jgi:hypothetical protein
MNVDPASLNTEQLAAYTGPGKMHTAIEFLLNIIPTTVVDAFAKGEILQVLLFAVLFGFALQRLAERGAPMLAFVESFSQVLFGIVGMVMRLAPIGAFGAMAFTIGKYGFGSLLSLGKLMGSFYLTCLLFIFGALGLVAYVHGFSVWKFVRYIREELFVVLGTSSSESALPRMIEQTGGWIGYPRRVLLQSRRDVDLFGHGDIVHRAGHQHAARFDSANHLARRAFADIQRRCGRDRQRFHRARRHLGFRRNFARCRAGTHSRHRSIHVGSSRAHQCDRQRSGDTGGSAMDRRAGCSENAP